MNVAFEPACGGSVWDGASLDRTDYAVELDSHVLDEFGVALRSIASAKKDLADVGIADFSGKVFREFSWDLQHRLATGPGFLVINGWCQAGWSEAELRLLLWGFGAMIGHPRVQNLRGDRISVVAKEDRASSQSTATIGDSTVSKGDDEIRFHTEKGRLPIPPRIIALLSMQKSASGGESRVVSGHSVYNRLLARNPELLARLHEPFPLGRHEEPYADGLKADWAPVFSKRDDQLVVRYNRPWVHVAEQRLGWQLDEPGRRALDAVDAALDSQQLCAEFILEPGELLLVDNRKVLHARKKFYDGDSPTEKRRLLRLWLD